MQNQPLTANEPAPLRGTSQGSGESEGKDVTFVGGAIFVGGSARGNLSVSLNHATNGAFGEVDNHEDVDGGHATGSFADGEFDDPATAQHGMDIFIYKLSINGVPEAIYAADTMPSDGITDGRSENGKEGGVSQLVKAATARSGTSPILNRRVIPARSSQSAHLLAT